MYLINVCINEYYVCINYLTFIYKTKEKCYFFINKNVVHIIFIFIFSKLNKYICI